MQLYCAPMEGITGYLYRLVQNRWFGGIDRYYMPFLSPTQTHCFSKKEWKEVLPENNTGIYVIPQILARNPDDFLWAAADLAKVGYTEINLNLGCPSGTVVSKGKGSGFLGRPLELEDFLDRIFTECPLKISIKTRLGLSDPEEFPPLLDLFQRYPVEELIIHPRVQKDFYKHPARRENFTNAIKTCQLPVCYNGDLNTAQQCLNFQAEFPSVKSLMLGRGLVGDPALARKVRGGNPATRDELRAFHDHLYEEYCVAFNSQKNAMMRMKEMWYYLIGLFEDDGRTAKALRKAADPITFEAQTKYILNQLPLKTDNHTSCL